MVNRIVSVGDDFTLPPAVKIGDANLTPEAVAANLPARLEVAALDGTYATKAELAAAGTSTDALTLQRIDREALQRARTSGATAAIAYADATELTKDWADLTGWSNGSMAVTSNRLHYSGTGSLIGALKSFPVAAGESAHISTVMRFVAGGGTQATYFGIDTGSADHAIDAINSPGGAFIGWNSAGVKGSFLGASFGAGKIDELNIGPALSSGDYLATVDIDPTFITFALTRIGAPGNDYFTFKVSRADLTAGGKTINNISFFGNDARGVGGHSFGPVAAVKSLQPTRTKTLAGQAVEGLAHRTITTRSALADNWRLSLPKGYDARRPAPVVLYHHQSLTGNDTTPWAETRAQPVTNALNNAGYIVATAYDGGDRWGNQTSLDNYRALYEYVRSNFSTGPLFLLGVSMGFLPVLNALVRRDLPTPAAAASIGGVADLDTLFMGNTGSYAAGIRASYGIAADGSDYDAKTAGFNPADRDGKEFRGVPMRFYTSAGDTAVPRATNADAMSAKVAAYAPEEVVVTGAGGHLDPSQFNASDLVSFFGRYL